MTALALRRAPLPRRVLAAALAAVYALPLGLGAASDLSHGAFHAMEQFRERRAEAVALGLVHLGEQSTYTHTHGGVTHSHAGPVDALIVAANQADDEADAVAPLVKLSAHAPAVVVQTVIVRAVSRVTALLDPGSPESPRALPPVPPPRA